MEQQDEHTELQPSLLRFDETTRSLHVGRSVKIPRPGIILAIVTTISFSLCGMLAKNVVGKLGAGEVVSVRYIISGFIMSLPIIFNSSSLHISQKKWLIGCTGGLLGGATTFVAYTAYLYIPLMDAQTLFNIQGIFVAILSCIFLKEKIGGIDICSLVIVLGGVILVCQPSFIFTSTSHSASCRDRIIGTGFGLLCAFCQGMTGVLCRSLKDVKFYVFTFLLSCGGIVFSLAMMPVTGDMPYPTTSQFGQLIAIGLLACISKGTLTLAFQMEDATPVTMVQSLEIVWAFFLQWLFFADRPNYLEVVGAVLVIVGISLITTKHKILDKLDDLRNKEENRPLLDSESDPINC